MRSACEGFTGAPQRPQKNLPAEVISGVTRVEQISVVGVEFARDRMTAPSRGHNRHGATAAAVKR
jgi:hypothetical protein